VNESGEVIYSAATELATPKVYIIIIIRPIVT
jgi:hypothetical protein